MCEFISWIELDDTILYLTDRDLRGKRFKGYKDYNAGWRRDIVGHGAIRWFLGIPENKGKDKECTDFSKPSNFPDEIVKAIQECRMTKFGEVPKGLLKGSLYDKYDADLKPLNDKHKADRESLDDKYWADLKPLDDKYRADLKPLDDKYDADQEALDDRHWLLFANNKNRAKAWRDFE